MARAWCATPEAADLSWIAEGHRAIARAKAACAAHCPVVDECGAWELAAEGAMTEPGRAGVWGAMSTRERDAAARTRRKQERGEK
nr:WhiB family transcriptional regulator [Cellulomonas sp. RIT-PI-Y]